MIIRKEESIGHPSTVGELIGVLTSVDPNFPVQFDDLGIPIDVIGIEAEPEDGELHEYTEWIEIRPGD